MKLVALVSLALVAGTVPSGANAHEAHRLAAPHLELEMTSQEYAARLEGADLRSDSPLTPILGIGKRALDWITAINAGRPEETKLQLTTPETTTGTPIDTPRLSNPEIILADYARVQAEMPAAMHGVIFGDGALPSEPLVDDDTFLTHARLLDRVYQAAARWLLQEPWLDAYAAYAAADVRGLYNLERIQGLREKLHGWSRLPAAERAQLSTWIRGLCRNADVEAAACRTSFERAEAEARGVLAYYDRYIGAARAHWDAFFRVVNPRPEARWEGAAAERFVLPFLTPEESVVEDWLRDNIEDEWRFGGWQLKLDFTTEGEDLVRVRFVPGATPNVNKLGGSIITMDANRPIDGYLERWTIRHELGHVLGYPDCYVEFFDTELSAMVSYQLDITNLMCSRRGHLQEQHVQELRRAYPHR